MSKTYSRAESVEAIANSLIPTHHPELVTATIIYLFMDGKAKKGGRELYGKAKKISGMWEYLVESNFALEISSEAWTELEDSQRIALVDHLLECCTGVEDEKSGEIKWAIREPDVQEFSSILNRHGIWHPTLGGFVKVAQSIDLDGIIDEEVGEEDDEEDNEVELDLNEI